MPVSDLRPWHPITYSCDDTSHTRRQVVAHNSAYDSLKKQRATVYRDTCPPKKDTPTT